jgi:carbamoyl-phosphate synthase large subunit
MNILFSCIGKRGYIADYFREVLPHGSKIVGTSNSEWTPGFASCDISVVVPPITSDEYIPTLLDECRKHEISALLSFFDPDVHRLSEHSNDFRNVGVVPIIPERRASIIAFDKLETYRFMLMLEIATPATTDSLTEAIEWINQDILTYPLVVKPRFGFGSANTFIARNKNELYVFYNYEKNMIIQQFMDAEAVNVDGLGDLTACPVSVVPWRKLLSRMGETERSITIENPDLVNLARRLIKEVGIIGPFDGDFFIDSNGKLWVLELNLRFGGGYPVSHLAGADFPDKIMKIIRGEPLESCNSKYKRGVTMMKRLQIIEGPKI